MLYYRPRTKIKKVWIVILLIKMVNSYNVHTINGDPVCNVTIGKVEIVITADSGSPISKI